MAFKRVPFTALFALSSLLCITFLSAKPPVRGFSLNLIPRDSFNSRNSPLSDPDDESRFDNIRSAIARSIVRADRISTFGHGLESATDPESNVISASGEYIMNISIGTPPFPILAIADTGSDLIWTQCKPCSSCYEQKAPLFDSTKSSTYKPVPCSAPECTTRAIGFNPSCDRSDNCQYAVAYGDQSTSNGAIATETVTLGSSKFSKIVFGCGFDNRGTFSEAGSGIIGLGNGPDSLIGQMNSTIGGKFSYCLVPMSSKGSKSSDISFGTNGVVSGRGVVSTPIVEKEPSTFYWLTLEAITIGNVRVPFTNSNDYGGGVDSEGNIIIDSGTTLLILPEDFYTSVEAEVVKQVRAKRVSGVQSLTCCFDSSSFKAPEIAVNFEGADVKLNDFNAFVEVADGVICFAAAPSSMGIYGNLAQMDFLVLCEERMHDICLCSFICKEAGEGEPIIKLWLFYSLGCIMETALPSVIFGGYS